MYSSNSPAQPFSIMAKPTGALCNLNCNYCYYLEKENMYEGTSSFKMDEELLETFTRKYIHEHPSRELSFLWQGGEPTLLGIGFYEKALQLQKKYGSGKVISNAFQTNGILLNDDWCEFFKKNNFLVGISIDGPQQLHDQYRTHKGGQGSFDKVMRGIELLKKHRVEFNTLTVINNLNVEHPQTVYRFLKQIGSTHLQFIPVVERISCSKEQSLSLVLPDYQGQADIAPWSVSPAKYGQFLVAIFKDWVKKDVGRIFVQLFEAALANEVGVPAGVCLFNQCCGDAFVMEHNGDIFSCDHYVYPEYKLGNVRSTKLNRLTELPFQQQFGLNKYTSLPEECLECSVKKYCWGECPKHRFVESKSGERNLNYFCESYKAIFGYARPYVKFMANEFRNERSPANVMYAKRI
jgi:uncharacterized protein